MLEGLTVVMHAYMNVCICSAHVDLTVVDGYIRGFQKGAVFLIA
jgi:hypothetical protein